MAINHKEGKTLSLPIELIFREYGVSRGSAHGIDFARKIIKTGSMYHGFYTSRGRKFPYGNFRTSVFCEVRTQIVGKTLVFRQPQSRYSAGNFLPFIYKVSVENPSAQSGIIKITLTDPFIQVRGSVR